MTYYNEWHFWKTISQVFVSIKKKKKVLWASETCNMCKNLWVLTLVKNLENICFCKILHNTMFFFSDEFDTFSHNGFLATGCHKFLWQPVSWGFHTFPFPPPPRKEKRGFIARGTGHKSLYSVPTVYKPCSYHIVWFYTILKGVFEGVSRTPLASSQMWEAATCPLKV